MFSVKLAKDMKTGTEVALKIMKTDVNKSKNTKLLDLFYNEINTMKTLDHPNVLKVLGHSERAVAEKTDGSKIVINYMALELAKGGEIFDFIAESGRFSEKVARYYFHQLISALEYMHKQGLYHRDLKPENLLLDEQFNLKIADFGFATSEDISVTRKGTYGYMAPEVLEGSSYRGEEADLFAAGVILFILATQHPPFIRAEPEDRYYKSIISNQWDQFWEVHADSKLSTEFIDMLSKMLCFDPTERLNLDEIKAHKWFRGPVPSHDEVMKEFSYRRSLISKLKDNKKRDKHAKKAKSGKHDKDNKPRKFTKFFDVKDGDELIDAIVEFAKTKGYKYIKSKEFFRVELIADQPEGELTILVNVLKKPDEDLR